MLCPTCKTDNPQKARFCLACGQPFDTTSDTLDGVSTLHGRVTADARALEDTLVGRCLNGYRIERCLGRGGMGVVFKAEQIALGRTVALKVLVLRGESEGEFIERFQREAKAIAGFEHPHIVAIHDMFSAEGMFCIAMSYQSGGSLKQMLKDVGPLPEVRVAALVRDAALGLWAASERGIVHRDVKPDNLLLGSDGRVRVGDFGLARAAEDALELTQSGALLGTPAFMPPEQWEDLRKADHRSDLYALGCTLYQLLVGRAPFRGPSGANLMKQHAEQPPPPLRDACPQASEEMAKIVATLLEKEPSRRFQTGLQLAKALEPLAGGTTPTLTGAAAAKAGAEPAGEEITGDGASAAADGAPSSGSLAPLFAVLAVAALLGAVWWFDGRQHDEPETVHDQPLVQVRRAADSLYAVWRERTAGYRLSNIGQREADSLRQVGMRHVVALREEPALEALRASVEAWEQALSRLERVLSGAREQAELETIAARAREQESFARVHGEAAVWDEERQARAVYRQRLQQALQAAPAAAQDSLRIVLFSAERGEKMWNVARVRLLPAINRHGVLRAGGVAQAETLVVRGSYPKAVALFDFLGRVSDSLRWRLQGARTAVRAQTRAHGAALSLAALNGPVPWPAADSLVQRLQLADSLLVSEDAEVVAELAAIEARYRELYGELYGVLRARTDAHDAVLAWEELVPAVGAVVSDSAAIALVIGAEMSLAEADLPAAQSQFRAADSIYARLMRTGPALAARWDRLQARRVALREGREALAEALPDARELADIDARLAGALEAHPEDPDRAQRALAAGEALLQAAWRGALREVEQRLAGQRALLEQLAGIRSPSSDERAARASLDALLVVPDTGEVARFGQLRAASQAAAAIVAERPLGERVLARAKLARASVAAQRFDTALEAYDAILREIPEDGTLQGMPVADLRQLYRIERADACLQADRPQLALADCEAVHAEGLHEGSGLEQELARIEAFALARLERLPEAVAVALPLLTVEEGIPEPELWLRTIVWMLRLGDAATAQEKLGLLLEHLPAPGPQPHELLAEALAMQGAHEEALLALDRAIALEATSARYERRVWLRARLGRVRGALDDVERARGGEDRPALLALRAVLEHADGRSEACALTLGVLRARVPAAHLCWTGLLARPEVPDESWAQVFHALVRGGGDPEQVAAVLAETPDNALKILRARCLQAARGVVLLRAGEVDRAREALASVSASHRDAPALWAVLRLSALD